MDAAPQVRELCFRGKTAYQAIADCPVTLTRPAQPKRQAALIKGEPIAARLLVSRITDDNGKLLAQWYLLSNAPVTAQTLARGTTGGGKSNASSNCSNNNKAYNWKTGSFSTTTARKPLK